MKSAKVAVVLLSVAVLAAQANLNTSFFVARGAQKEGQDDKRDADRKAIQATHAKLVAAFNKGNARQMAALWTVAGEFVEDSGTRIRGRAAIEKTFTDYFQKEPGSTAELKETSLRFLSRDTAIAEGHVQVTKKGEGATTSTTRFSGLYVREDGQWHLAVLREWEEAGAVSAKLSDLEWLIGHWMFKNKEREVYLHYTWSTNKSFIHAHFQSKEGDKIVSSGMQIIGRDPVEDVIRSWVFNSDGSYGHAIWTHEKGRWNLAAASKLINGTESSATNLLQKVSNDVFTWQSVNRRLNSEAQPDTTPIKVHRVKGKKVD